MAEVIFFIAAIGAVAGAVGTVALRNPFYSVLALVCHLLALAALFLLLRAEFVAAAQVVVYAGAVMVLYVFVVAYVGGSGEPMGISSGATLRFASLVFALALFAELTIALVGTSLSALNSDGAPYEPGFGSPAAVGAVILARRRSGLSDPREISVAEFARGEVTKGDDEQPELVATMLGSGGPPPK